MDSFLPSLLYPQELIIGKVVSNLGGILPFIGLLVTYITYQKWRAYKRIRRKEHRFNELIVGLTNVLHDLFDMKHRMETLRNKAQDSEPTQVANIVSEECIRISGILSKNLEKYRRFLGDYLENDDPNSFDTPLETGKFFLTQNQAHIAKAHFKKALGIDLARNEQFEACRC